MMSNEKSKLVYSTDKTVSRKQKPVEKSSRAKVSDEPQKVVVRLERRGRGGKTVTVIDGLRMRPGEMEELLRELKTRLGTGGTIGDSTLEIQGDHRDMVMLMLKRLGFVTRRSGG